MKRFLLILCGFLLVLTYSFGQGTSLSVDLQTVAIARYSKAENISVKQFKEYVQWLTYTKIMSTQDPNAKLTDNEKRRALDELGNQFLANQAAEQEKITVPDRDFNQYFEQRIEVFSQELEQTVYGRKPTTAEVDTQLMKMIGMSRASYRELMKRTMVTENYLREKKKSLFDAIKQPTDSEILTIYNEVKNKSIFQNGFIRPDTVRIRMIIVPFRNAGEKTAAQTKANELSRQIGADAGKFDETSRDYLKPNSGYVSRDAFIYKENLIREAMGPDFVDAVFRLKQGEVSKVIERPDGFYIVKVTETYRSKTLALDDVYNLTDPQPVTVKQTIAMAAMQQRFMETLQRAQEELVEDLKKKGTVQVMSNVYNSISW